jgi:hypothetical protein
MKQSLFILLFFFNFLAFSQNLESLKILTKKIHDANYTMDFDVVTELTYPKIYELMGKAAFIDKLDKDYQNADFRMRIQIESPIFQYSEIKKIAGQTFCVVTYKNPIRYFFENKMNAESGQRKAASLKESAQAYETIYEPKRNSINMKRNTKFIAIADETTANQWKFFNLDDLMQRESSNKLLNESIKKELGL